MLRASAESVLFTNIYGGCHNGGNKPISSILEIDGVRVLLDCGLDFNATPAAAGLCLTALLPHLPTVDCVLLSSPDAAFCGALPFVLKHARRGVPIIAPSALSKIATHNVLGRFMSRYANEAEFPLHDGSTPHTYSPTSPYVMTTDDIFNAFRAVKEPYGNRTVLKRLEELSSGAKRNRVDTADGAAFDSSGGVVTASDFEGVAYAGDNGDALDADEGGEALAQHIVAEPIGNYRIIGGYMWRLAYQTDDILYCPDFSLNPSALLRRTAMPTRSSMTILGFPPGYAQQQVGAAVKQHPNGATPSYRALFDEHMPSLIRHITDTFRREKDVLMPVTLSGRGLEMLMTLRSALQEKGVTSYQVVLLHYQAKELLARLKTMTSLLLDQLVYEAADPFADIFTCKSVDEVALVPSPKLVFADGLTLDDSLAPELLVSFLASAGNLVITVVGDNSVSEGTNATRLLEHYKHVSSSGFSWQYLRRAKLNKLELEHYYLAQEQARELQLRHEEENAARRRQQAAAVAFTEDMREGVTDKAAWDDDDDDVLTSAGAGTATSALHDAASNLKQTQALPDGLYLPERTAELLMRSVLPKPVVGAGGQNNGIVFPQLESSTSLAMFLASPNHGNEDRGYGIPLSNAELAHLRRAAPHRVINDDAPVDLIHSVNDAQLEANIPCKIVVEAAVCDRVAATVVGFPVALYEGSVDAQTMRQVFLSRLAATVRKIVPLRASKEDVSAFSMLCQEEVQSFRAVASAQRGGVARGAGASVADTLVVGFEEGAPTQLAVAVFAFTVDLDPRFVSYLQTTLRPVHETKSAGYWEVGHVNGVLDSRSNIADMALVETQQPINDGGTEVRSVKRRRLEGGGVPVLTFPSPSVHNHHIVQEDSAAADDDDQGEVPLGSVYVGALELPIVREQLRQQLRQRVEVVRGLLTLDDVGACVRKSPSGDITLSCIAGSSMFDIRETIYAQYQHNL